MKNARYISIAVGIGFVVIISIILWEENSTPTAIEEWLVGARQQEDVIEFYGKVVDQFGEGVSNAKVNMSITHPSLIPQAPEKLEITTGESGSFSITRNTGKRGFRLRIGTIEKEGYEYKWYSDLKNSFSYRTDNPQQFNPEPDNPIVFRVRKIGTVSTFLLEYNFMNNRIRFRTPDAPDWLDFIESDEVWIDFIRQKVFTNEPKNDVTIDLHVSGRNLEDQGWEITFDTPAANAGLMPSEAFLSNAMSSNYVKRHSITIPFKTSVQDEIYLYVVGREPRIYSLFSMYYISSNRTDIAISFKVYTNPYGDTIMEPDNDIPGRLEYRLEQEAKEALLAGRLAVRPANLEELKKAMQE